MATQNKLILDSPIWSLYENYVSQVLTKFASDLSVKDRPIIVNSYPFGVLERLKHNKAVVHIFTEKVAPSVLLQTREYKQDTLTFVVDVYTAPTEESSLAQGETQEELAYRLGLCYSNWVRSAILDLSACSPTMYDPETRKKEPITAQLRWLGCENIIDTNTYEIAIACQRQKFTIDLPYYPTDSNIYIMLKEVLAKFNVEEKEV